FFFFSSRRRHTRSKRDWSSDVCSSDLPTRGPRAASRRPTVCALIRQVAAAWSTERPVHLVADRGFPSRPLLLTLRQVHWGWTLRSEERRVGKEGRAGWAARE